jgi:hypothetical protein
MSIRCLFVIAGLSLLNLAAVAQKVTYDYDKAADFSSYKTFAWDSAPTNLDQFNHLRVVNAVESQMATKGFTMVASNANPDVLLNYTVDFDRSFEVTATGPTWGAFRFGGGIGSARADDVMIGTLTVEFMDPATRQVVWRATATKDVDRGSSPEKREKGLNKAAAKLFKNYPPIK